MGLNGVEVILNSSASHAELRKLNTRLNLIQNCTGKLGGLYVYANATGVGTKTPPEEQNRTISDLTCSRWRSKNDV
jgi:predicted mannosyl-3-phosphoglycerate phosphatase (HAD superfamily)